MPPKNGRKTALGLGFSRFLSLLNCHCDEYASTTKQPALSKWIATLISLARNDGKAFAFTLAEVLITLTIIGVIAALTIPNLMQKYTKHSYVVGLKKAYSQLQNAVKMIPITENCPTGDFECTGFFNSNTNIDGQNFNNSVLTKANYLLSKQMKLRGFCAQNTSIWTNSSKDICYRPNNAYPYTRIYGAKKPGFITQDGVLWAVWPQTQGNTTLQNVAIDLNGIKGPNKGGIDVFEFIITGTEKDVNGKKLPAGTVLPAGGPLYWRYVYGWGQQSVNCPGSTNCTWKVLNENAMNY